MTYNKEKRHQGYLNLKKKRDKKCLDCNCQISPWTERCKRCANKENGKNRLGKKLSEDWCENISKGQSEEKSHRWKGNKVDYSALHRWVRKNKGVPENCEACGLKNYYNKRRFYLEWANKSGDYKRKLDDWIALCPKCHYWHHKTMKGGKTITVGRQTYFSSAHCHGY